MQEEYIDIEKVIKSKNPKLLKWLPKFLISYLKKTLHQEEINQILLENKDKFDYDFAKDIIKRFNVKVNTYGIENIPKEGGYIFASNHDRMRTS